MTTAVRNQGESHSLPTSTMEDSHIDIDALLARPRITGRRKQGPLYKAPEFVKRLNSFVEVTVGQDVLFECHWKAFPKPDIRWFRDEEEITHNPRYLIKEGDNGVLTLLIRKATKADEGAYKCRAENKEGLGSTTGYLSVKGDRKDKVLSAQPRKHAEHAVSYPPNLRTITEQQSIEEREEGDYEPLFPPNWPGGYSFPQNITCTLPGSRRDNDFDVAKPLSNGDQKRGHTEAPLADEEDTDDLLSSSTDQDVFQCDVISDDDGSMTPPSEPLTPIAKNDPHFLWPTSTDNEPSIAATKLNLDSLQLNLDSLTKSESSTISKYLTYEEKEVDLTTKSGNNQLAQSNDSLSNCTRNRFNDNTFKESDDCPQRTKYDNSGSMTDSNSSHGLVHTNIIKDGQAHTEADSNMEFPWPWYILFIVCCEFWGNIAYVNPIVFVCCVASVCFVSFIITFSLSFRDT